MREIDVLLWKSLEMILLLLRTALVALQAEKDKYFLALGGLQGLLHYSI